MYMVLVQDFFEVDAIDPVADDAWQRLHGHLQTGHMAVLLVKRRENGHLHWIVATESQDHNVLIYDSLIEAPYPETPDFMTDHVVTAMLIRPDPNGEQPMSSVQAHKLGSAVLADATKRMKAMK